MKNYPVEYKSSDNRKNTAGNAAIDYRTRKNSLLSNRTCLNFLALLCSTLVYNISNLLFFVLKSIFSSKKSIKLKRMIILGFGGIGNHLMLDPAIRCLKIAYPELIIHIVTSSNACAEVLKNNPNISSLSVMNISNMINLSDYFHAGKALKLKKPDAVLAASGMNPVAGSWISFLSRAPIRIGEDWKGRGFLYTHKMKINSLLSEVERNLALIKLLGISTRIISPKLYLTKDEIDEARKWLSKFKIPAGTKLLGIHPGSSKKQEWKRWGIEKFAEVAKKIAKIRKVRSIFFFGPEESDLMEVIEKAGIDSAIIVKGKGSIRKTAAIISCCHLFLSNDSGLRHIAGALGVRTVGIFGPTSVVKNHFGGETHKIILKKNVLCSPCHYTRWWLSCGGERPCLRLVSADKVVNLLL